MSLDWARYLMRTVWTNLYCDTVWTISILCCLYWRCHTLCTLLLGMWVNCNIVISYVSSVSNINQVIRISILGYLASYLLPVRWLWCNWLTLSWTSLWWWNLRSLEKIHHSVASTGCRRRACWPRTPPWASQSGGRRTPAPSTRSCAQCWAADPGPRYRTSAEKWNYKNYDF